MPTIAGKGFVECTFCGIYVVDRQYETHIKYCLENPHRKQRKEKVSNFDKEKYDFSLTHIEENAYFNSRNIAHSYYKLSIKEKPIGSQTYEFSRMLGQLHKEGKIERYNGRNYRKVV